MGPIRPLTVKLFSGSYAVGGNGGVNDFAVNLGAYRWVGHVTLTLQGTRTAGSSTLDLTLNANVDGTNLSSLLAFTQQNSASLVQEHKQIAVPGAAAITTDMNLGTGTTCTVTLYASGFVEGGATSPA